MHRGVGTVDEFIWLELGLELWDIDHLLKQHFEGRFLLISCFDSSPISPVNEERALGWRSVAAGMLSPPLSPGLALPREQYDEWWIFESAREAEAFPAYECFVNMGSWSLRCPADIESNFDPTWERGRFEWLPSQQKIFWKMVSTHRPLAFVANGDSLIIASRHQALIDAIASRAA